MAAKCCKARKEISSSNKKKGNQKSDIKDDTNLDKVTDDKYLLQL